MMNHHQVHCLHKKKCMCMTFQPSFQYKHKYINPKNIWVHKSWNEKDKWLQQVNIISIFHILLAKWCNNNNAFKWIAFTCNLHHASCDKFLQLIMLPINAHITLKSAFTTEKCKPYLLKKSNDFLPSQLNGDVFCWKSSSCESSWLTSMMESPLPFLSNSLSNCFLCHGWVVGCNVQHWSMRWPLFWQWVQIFCILFSRCLCL